jgi:hypothetical protein
VRDELRRVVDALLAASEDSRQVTLDAVGDAIGTLAVDARDVEAIFDALEAAGRRIGAPSGSHGESRLREVLVAARALRAELGRAPTAEEVAARSGLSLDAVRHALALAKVMQR